MKKGRIITELPKLKHGKTDWFLTKGKEVEVETKDYGILKFKITDVYRYELYTMLSLEYDNKYIGDIDCKYLYEGNVGMLIGKEPNRIRKLYFFDKEKATK